MPSRARHASCCGWPTRRVGGHPRSAGAGRRSLRGNVLVRHARRLPAVPIGARAAATTLPAHRAPAPCDASMLDPLSRNGNSRSSSPTTGCVRGTTARRTPREKFALNDFTRSFEQRSGSRPQLEPSTPLARFRGTFQCAAHSRTILIVAIICNAKFAQSLGPGDAARTSSMPPSIAATKTSTGAPSDASDTMAGPGQ
jgi:hypothetical protein